jgi:hypothetical protein
VIRDVDYGQSLCLAFSDGGFAADVVCVPLLNFRLAFANYNAEKTKSYGDISDSPGWIMLSRSHLRCWSPRSLCYPQKDANSYARSSC